MFLSRSLQKIYESDRHQKYDNTNEVLFHLHRPQNTHTGPFVVRRNLSVCLFLKFVEVCTKITEFDGKYTRTSEIGNEYPIYRHSENWEAIWNGVQWVFSDPQDQNGEMVDQDQSFQMYPENGHTWNYFSRDLGVVTFVDCNKKCVFFLIFFDTFEVILTPK